MGVCVATVPLELCPRLHLGMTRAVSEASKESSSINCHLLDYRGATQITAVW